MQEDQKYNFKDKREFKYILCFKKKFCRWRDKLSSYKSIIRKGQSSLIEVHIERLYSDNIKADLSRQLGPMLSA